MWRSKWNSLLHLSHHDILTLLCQEELVKVSVATLNDFLWTRSWAWCWSQSRFSSRLLLWKDGELVFDKVGSDWHASQLVRLGDDISSYRLLSIRCNEILTPYVFQKCELRANLISPKKDKVLNQVGKQIQAYCTVLDCGTKPLDWEKVATFLAGCNRLKTLLWHCPASSLSDWIPASISSVLRDNEVLQLQYRGAFLASAVTRVTNPRYHLAPAWHRFPIKNLTSFTSYDTVMCSDMQRLSEFLADAPHLTELSLDLSGSSQLSQSRFLSSKKLSALSSLHIMGNWYYTKEEVTRYWDFSQLTNLNLIDNPLYQRRSTNDNGVTQQFLKSVPMDQLERVTSLEIAHVNYYGFGFIQRLIMQHINCLERLRLRSSSPMDFKHALMHHTDSLHSLTLELLPGLPACLDSEHILTIRELAKLSNLVILSLDLDFVTGEQWMIPENQVRHCHISTILWPTQLLTFE